MLNLFDYINESLGKTTENIWDSLNDTMEKIKSLMENKIELEKAERCLQDYFEGNGKELYEKLIDYHGNDEACYSISFGENGKQIFSIYNVIPKHYNLEVDNNIENVGESVVFSIKSGRVIVDEKKTEEFRNASPNYTNYFSKYYKIINENKFPDIFMEQLDREMLEEVTSYANDKEIGEGVYKVDSFVYNGRCRIFEFRRTSEEDMFMNMYMILASELPEGASKNALLLKKDGKFVLDKEGNELMENKLVESAKNYVEGREEYLKTMRVEGDVYYVRHKFYFIETDSEIIYIQRENDEYAFQDSKIPEELYDKIEIGTALRYENGTYVIDEELSNLNI